MCNLQLEDVQFDFETSTFSYLNHTQIRSWNQPVHSSKDLCSRKTKHNGSFE